MNSWKYLKVEMNIFLDWIVQDTGDLAELMAVLEEYFRGEGKEQYDDPK